MKNIELIVGNLKLSIGSLFFIILLLIIYIYRTRESIFGNVVFKILLTSTLFSTLSEIIAILLIYILGPKNSIAIVACDINIFATMLWMYVVLVYLFAANDEYSNSENLIYYIRKNKILKYLLLFEFLMFILGCVVNFSNVCDENGAYIHGAPMVFLYIYGIIAVLTCIILTFKNGSSSRYNASRAMLVCAIAGVIDMTLQILDPYVLMINIYLSFVCYILYFEYENPDLYVSQDLEKAREKAIKSNRAKSDFLTNMSHEIRTPISTILGLSEGIINLSNVEWDNVKEDVYHINSSGENLLEVINNILDVSKIESGDEYMDYREYSLGNVVSDIKSVAQAKITSNDVSFIINMDKNIPSLLRGDKNKVFQILLNLVNNAIKFTNEGKISITITSELKDGRAHLFFKVLDTGIGISEEKQKDILNKLANSNELNTETGNKSGLGLIITNNLAHVLGGNFKFESVYGAGSTFSVDIYQDVADMTPLGDYLVNLNNDKKINKIDCSGFNVLLVDDNRLNLKVAERKLEAYKFNIYSYNSGLECIDAIKKEEVKYDLILLDHIMNDIDGIEVLHVLRNMDGYNIPPIVMLTANALAGMKDVYLNEGFNDYIAKPINDEELDNVINKYFKNKVLEKEKKKAENVSKIKEEANENSDLKVDTLEIKYLQDAGIDYVSSLKYVGDIDTYNNTLIKFSGSIDDFIKKVNIARIKKDNLAYSNLFKDLCSSCETLGINALANDLKKHEEAGNKNDMVFISDNFDDIIMEIKKNKNVIDKYLKIKN